MTGIAPDVLREAVIDLDALRRNVRHLRRVTGVDVIGVVKADAYGHGAVRVARAAVDAGVTALGVTDVAEALELRRAGITAPVLSWLHAPGVDFAEAVDADVTLGLSTLDQLRRAAAAAGERPARVHLKLETGLSRNGFSPDEWAYTVREAARLEQLGAITVDGLFSHLSNTSPADDLAALAAFAAGVDVAHGAGLRPRLRHIAATQAALLLPEARLDAVRIGIGMYGLNPDGTGAATDVGLQPVMSLHARVVNVRRVTADTGVSYGYTHRTRAGTTLALVPVGYADGIPRAASSRGTVAIRGVLHPVVGRVAMDQCIVDVGDTDVAVGDEVVVFGDPSTGVPSVEDWAAAADTINYEIVTRIGQRVPRRVVGA